MPRISKSTRRKTAKRRSRRLTAKQYGGSLALTANNLLIRNSEVAKMRELVTQQMASRGFLERKQTTNELVKYILQTRILPFNNHWRATVLGKLNEFLVDMANEPEYYENIMAAIAHLQQYGSTIE